MSDAPLRCSSRSSRRCRGSAVLLARARRDPQRRSPRRATTSRGCSSTRARSASSRAAVRLDAAALRVVPDPDLLDLRPVWWAVGLIQIVVAVATALLVYEIGRAIRLAPGRAGRGGDRDAEPVPRLARRPRQPRDPRPAARGRDRAADAARRSERPVALARVRSSASCSGSRSSGTRGSSFLPIVCCAYLVVAAAARACDRLVGVVLAARCSRSRPGSSATRCRVGCFTLTTDTRALWKANNLNTYDTLAAGQVDRRRRRRCRTSRRRPEFAGGLLQGRTGKVLPVDECGADALLPAPRRSSSGENHPGREGEARRAGGRDALEPERRRRRRADPSRAGIVDTAARVGEPAYIDPALPARARRRLPRCRGAFAWLARRAARVPDARRRWRFAGATRYRVPWDFLLALAAAAAIGGRVDRRMRAR